MYCKVQRRWDTSFILQNSIVYYAVPSRGTPCRFAGSSLREPAGVGLSNWFACKPAGVVVQFAILETSANRRVPFCSPRNRCASLPANRRLPFCNAQKQMGARFCGGAVSQRARVLFPSVHGCCFLARVGVRFLAVMVQTHFFLCWPACLLASLFAG